MSDTSSSANRERYVWPLWLWSGALCFVRGVMFVSIMMIGMMAYKRLGLSDTMASLSMAVLFLPVAIRPLYAWFIRRAGKVKRWVIGTEVVFAVAMMEVAANIISASWEWKVWLWMAVASLAWAVHGVAADEICFSELAGERRRRVEIGANVFAIAVMFAGGMMVMVAGNMEVLGIGNVESVGAYELGTAWASAFKVSAAIVVTCMALLLLTLPVNTVIKDIGYRKTLEKRKEQMLSLIRVPLTWKMTGVAALFTLAQSFMVRGVPLFVASQANIGGLALGPQEVAFVLFTVGMMTLAFGLAIGVKVIHSNGLRRWLWPMAVAVVLPNAIYVYLAFSMPSDVATVSLFVGAAQLLCGFGMAALLEYMLDFCQSGQNRKKRFYACLSLLAFLLMVTGMLTGAMQDYLGFRKFFTLILLLAVAIFVVMAWRARPQRESEDD